MTKKRRRVGRARVGRRAGGPWRRPGAARAKLNAREQIQRLGHQKLHFLRARNIRPFPRLKRPIYTLYNCLYLRSGKKLSSHSNRGLPFPRLAGERGAERRMGVARCCLNPSRLHDCHLRTCIDPSLLSALHPADSQVEYGHPSTPYGTTFPRLASLRGEGETKPASPARSTRRRRREAA